MLACSPAGGDCIWGIHEVGQRAEGQFREVDGRDMLGGLGVPLVEFSYQPLHTFDIFTWSQLVLFNPISLPTY